MVYASSVMDEWYLTGRDRLFNNFAPQDFFTRRCPEDGALDDWHHREVHDT